MYSKLHLQIRRFVSTCLILISAAFSAAANEPETGELTLWITADINGYLTGCDCPDGASAGLSAIAQYLDEHRDFGAQPLIDAGGIREPDRSDQLLERFIDKAILELQYSGLLAVSSDLRDGRGKFRERQNNLPLQSGGAFRPAFFGMALPGQSRQSEPMFLEYGSLRIAVTSLVREGEQTRIDTLKNRGFRLNDTGVVVEMLSSVDADIRILVVRGSLDNLKIPVTSADLIVLTGEDSPAADIASGGRTGTYTTDSHNIPWLSLASRGNGLARVVFASRESSRPVVDIELISLERGLSAESPRILGIGDEFMEALTREALAAAARVRGEKSSKKRPELKREEISATYWYPYGCKECEQFLRSDLPRIEVETGKTLVLVKKDSSNPENFELMLGELAQRNTVLVSLPLLIIGDSVFQGDDAIHEGLPVYLTSGISNTEQVSEVSGKKIGTWEPGAVFLAGLLDGVNPCAFSAMVFLVSALALAGGSKRKTLLVGFSYAFGVFVTYSLVGAGLLGGLRQIVLSAGVRRVLEYLFVLFLGVLTILSLVDGMKLVRGRSDLLLKLPEKVSTRIHTLIREEVREGAAFGASLLLGGMVALLELGCTGQVYLPTIAWMISRGDKVSAWGWLLLYNIAFIIPLLLVFVLSFRGMKAVQMAKLFRSHGAFVKFATAGLFLTLALLVLFL